MKQSPLEFELEPKRMALSRELFGLSWAQLTVEQKRQYGAEWKRRNAGRGTTRGKRNRETQRLSLARRKQDPEYREYLKQLGKKWRKNNPEKAQRNTRRYRLKKEYGLTLEEYDAMLMAQGGKCAICEATKGAKSGSKRDAKLNIDHDHKTGKVRGLLCHNCNMVLGHLEDDIDRMYRAIEYLRSHQRSEVA